MEQFVNDMNLMVENEKLYHRVSILRLITLSIEIIGWAALKFDLLFGVPILKKSFSTSGKRLTKKILTKKYTLRLVQFWSAPIRLLCHLIIFSEVESGA